jgi:hypothetical protein
VPFFLIETWTQFAVGFSILSDMRSDGFQVDPRGLLHKRNTRYPPYTYVINYPKRPRIIMTILREGLEKLQELVFKNSNPFRITYINILESLEQ